MDKPQKDGKTLKRHSTKEDRPVVADTQRAPALFVTKETPIRARKIPRTSPGITKR